MPVCQRVVSSGAVRGEVVDALISLHVLPSVGWFALLSSAHRVIDERAKAPAISAGAAIAGGQSNRFIRPAFDRVAKMIERLVFKVCDIGASPAIDHALAFSDLD